MYFTTLLQQRVSCKQLSGSILIADQYIAIFVINNVISHCFVNSKGDLDSIHHICNISRFRNDCDPNISGKFIHHLIAPASTRLYNRVLVHWKVSSTISNGWRKAKIMSAAPCVWRSWTSQTKHSIPVLVATR